MSKKINFYTIRNYEGNLCFIPEGTPCVIINGVRIADPKTGIVKIGMPSLAMLSVLGVQIMVTQQELCDLLNKMAGKVIPASEK